MKKGKVTILTSILAITVLAMGLGAVTMAWFSDTAKATMTIQSGTVDVKLSKDSGTSWQDNLAFSFPSDWAPGDTYTIEIWMKNTGSAGLENLFVTGDNLGGPNPGLAGKINITDVQYTDRDPDTGGQMWVSPGNGHYYEGVFGDDSAPFTVTELAGGLTAGEKMNFCWGTPGVHGDYLKASEGRIQKFRMTFAFDQNADNTWQGKTCTFDLLLKGTDEPGTFVWWP